MEKTIYDTISPILKRLSNEVESSLVSEQLADVRKSLAELGQTLGERYYVSVEVTLQVYDQQKNQSWPAAQLGLGSDEGEEAMTFHEPPVMARYMIDGKEHIAAAVCCPFCWTKWGVKQQCPNCGTSAGNCEIAGPNTTLRRRLSKESQ